MARVYGPDMQDGLDEEALGVLAAFLARYLDDRARHENRTLEEYQALYPGHETIVAREWERLRDATSVPVPTTATERASVPLHVDPDAPLGMFGPYALLAELGRGGQATVFEARDTRDGRAVALKTFNPRTSTTGVAFRRFEREAGTTARIDHPGICKVLDAGVTNAVPWIAMELVEGETLSAVIARLRDETTSEGSSVPRRRTRQEIDVRMDVIEQVARALHVAHESNVIHRDVKPGNIMIRPDGSAVIVDFGFARLLDEDAPAITQSGDLFGTPPYMSPEQVARQSVPVDRRTDVYSLGVSLYESLTLHRPFSGPTRAALYQAILVRPAPDPREFVADIHKDLVTILEVAMDKDPDRRYATALGLAEDLARYRQRRPITARPPGAVLRLARWARRQPAVASGLLALVAGLSIGLVIALAQWREAERARASERGLVDLALIGRMQSWDDALWPASTANVEEVDRWSREASALVARLKANEGALREHADDRSAPTAERAAARHHVDVCNEGIVDLEDRIDRMAYRRDVAQQIDRWTDGPDIDRLWDSLHAWSKSHPAFKGVGVPRQDGLVPLGLNEATGLWEFWVAGCGPTPPAATSATARAGCVLILIPPATAVLGSTGEADENQAPRERRHRRKLDAYFIGKYEITHALYERVMRVNPSDKRPDNERYKKLEFTPRHPVDNVFWGEAKEFCRRMGGLLPTEAQWEHAARGGSLGEFAWPERAALRDRENIADQALKASRMAPEIATVTWDDGHVLTAPVGSFEANPFGLYDVHGNVAEWCRDYFESANVRFHPATRGDGLTVNPAPSRPDAVRNCAFRGGSYMTRHVDCRIARRFPGGQRVRYPQIGIRLARPVVWP